LSAEVAYRRRGCGDAGRRRLGSRFAEAEYSRVEGRSQPALWESAIAVWDRLGRPYQAACRRWRNAEALLAAGPSRLDATVRSREADLVARKLGAQPLKAELELLAQGARLDLTDPSADR
jgi:hypothetical protein